MKYTVYGDINGKSAWLSSYRIHEMRTIATIHIFAYSCVASTLYTCGMKVLYVIM